MKKICTSVVFAAAVACALPAAAQIMPKEIVAIKEDLEKAGATSCSKVMAVTLHYLANGRPFTRNVQWNSNAPNSLPISLDFLITGSKGNYSEVGSIMLVPIGDKCRGQYTITFVAPGQNCKTFIQKEGFDTPKWKELSADQNGDGGTGYFYQLTEDPTTKFILNDVAGGCSFTKRQPLTLDIVK